MVALHPYPRGFVIFRRDSSPALPEGWSTVSLGNSEWVFSHDHLETPELVAIGDGDRWVLVHGLCLYAGDDERDMTPGQRLAEAAAKGTLNLLDLLDLLGGRYIVLVGSSSGYSLYQDATGMRSVYFSQRSSLISSHVKLINACAPHQMRTDSDGRRGFIRSLSRSPYREIDALLPNHSLSVPSWNIHRFFPRDSNTFLHWSVEKRVSKYIDIWNRQWESLSNVKGNLLFSITGGQDSRTTMALVGEPLKHFQTFTYTKEITGSNKNTGSLTRDVDIVREIRKIFPLSKYNILTGSEEEPRLSSMYSSLSAHNATRGHGAWLIPSYAALTDSNEAIHVRGNVYGLFKAHWREKFPQGNENEILNWFLDQTRDDEPYEDRSQRINYYKDGLNRWNFKPSLFGYPISDLLYWEIRLGRWASDIYNETDIVFNSYDTANIRVLLNIALSFTEEQKNSGLLQSELINASFPILNFPGKNSHENLYEKTRNRGPNSPKLEPDANTPKVALHPGLVINSRGIPVRSIDVQNSKIWIPAAHFSPNHEIVRSFQIPNLDGELSFTVSNKYTVENPQRCWLVQIFVDNQAVLSWYGAKRERPVHATLENLRAGMHVSLHMIPLKDQRGKVSWEKATLTDITQSVFTARKNNAAVIGAADIVHALPTE